MHLVLLKASWAPQKGQPVSAEQWAELMDRLDQILALLAEIAANTAKGGGKPPKP